MDMVGSATIRRLFIPRDYFFILNLCHQIAADNANRFACRVDNFIGDSVFIQNASPFDSKDRVPVSGAHERLMLMMFALSATINEIHKLKTGSHPLDPTGLAKKLMDKAKIDVSFRAGLETGPAMIGPLGSQKRRIVTAIGKSVNNASRMESSGVQEHIHISQATLEVLENSHLSKDTALIWEQLETELDRENQENLLGIPFFKAYNRCFNLSSPISKQENVSYKEFSSPTTFLIQCIPHQL